MKWVLIAPAFLLLAPSWVVATAADSMTAGDLSAAIASAKVGTILRIETDGSQVEGKFRGLSEGVLHIDVFRPRLDSDRKKFYIDPVLISADSVRVVWRQDDRGGKYALVGFLAGFAIGAALPPDDDWVPEGTARVLTGVILGTTCSVVGLLLGSATKTWTPLYP